MDEFYVVLASNTLNDNQPGNFTTILPQQIRLTSDHRVCLNEISFRKSWKLLNTLLDTVILFHIGNRIRGIRLSKQSFTDITGLIQDINESIEAERSCPRGTVAALHRHHPELARWSRQRAKAGTIKGTTFRVQGNRVYIDRPVGLYGIWIAPPLRRILGIGDEQVFTKATEKCGIAQPSLSGDIGILYVYSDFIKQRVVSNSFTNLLKAVSIPPGNDGDRVCINFPNPEYIPVSQLDLNYINIKIRSYSGELVEFLAGETVLVLSFKSFKRMFV